MIRNRRWITWCGVFKRSLKTPHQHIFFLTSKSLSKIRFSVISYLVSFFIPILILLLIFAVIRLYPFGSKTFLVFDMKWQYADFFAYLKRIFNGEENLLYSFSKNYGGDMYSTWAYYLVNPLHWVICWFHQKDLPKALSWIVLIKSGLSGFSCFYYLRHAFSYNKSVYLFSTSYALMSYSLWNAENFQFLDAVVLVPFVVLGINYLADNQKPVLLTLSLSVAIVLNFYIGWMILFFSTLYFLYYCYATYGSLSRETMVCFFQSLLLTALLSAFLWIPVGYQILEHRIGINPFQPTFSSDISLFQLLTMFFTGTYEVGKMADHTLPNVFCGVFTSVHFFLFFFNQRISKKERFLTLCFSLFFVLSFLLFPLNLFWHGFHLPHGWPYRFSFLFSFLIISIAYRNYTQIKNKSISFLGFFSLIIITLLLAGFLNLQDQYSFESKSELHHGCPWLDVSLILFFILFLWQRDRKNVFYASSFLGNRFLIIVFLLSFVNLTFNALTLIKIKTINHESIDSYAYSIKTILPVVSEIQKIDPGFYRMEKNFYRSYNDSMQFDYAGISHFNSMNRSDILTFSKSLGYAVNNNIASYSYGATAFADSLSGIKYLLSIDSEIQKPYPPLFTMNGIHVFQNPFTLPLGFIARSHLEKTIPDDANPFNFQNSIYQYITGEMNQSLYSEAIGQEFSCQNVTCEISDNEIMLSKFSIGQKGVLQWKIPAKKDVYYYVYFPTVTDQQIDLEVNGKLLGRALTAEYSSVIPLGTTGDNHVITIRLFIYDSGISIHKPYIYSENLTALNTLHNLMEANPVLMKKINSAHLVEQVTVGSDNNDLILTIPHEKGWRVFVDHKPIQQKKVFNIFMLISLSSGKHDIDLYYIPPGLIPGFIVSFITVIIFLFLKPRRSRSL